MGQWGGFLYLVLPILLLLFLISRTRRQQREILAVQDQITVGSRVMMTSGIFGEVIAIDDDGIITLEIAPGVRTRWTRQAVARVVQDDDTSSDDVVAEPPS